MTESFLDGRVTLHPCDSRDVLRGRADASIDSVVTDPPYALVSIQKRFANSPRNEHTENPANPYGRTGRGFMGQKWDTGETAFAVEFWAEVLRVLKPGGHLVAFSGTRTYHRMAVAIEDAGFEIRDQIGWAYGSGFPKSHDVSKAIDKAGGASPREQSEMLRSKRFAAGLTREQVAEAVGCTPSSVRNWEEGRARAVGAPIEFIVPSENYRAKLADLLGYSADERRVVGIASDRRNDSTVYDIGHSGELRSGGHTDAARQWQGWGTALKPAWEPIVLARKPLIGTVAENVLQYGTGALNIDGCRVGVEERINGAASPTSMQRKSRVEAGYRHDEGRGPGSAAKSVVGRWPANIVHDGSDEVVAAFPYTAPAREGTPRVGKNGDGWGLTATGAEYNDVGGSAARFFYSAKADADDRLGSKHPTVKPVDLMQWLCRLVTPPGGVVLDPFAGTGTTGEAAFREGFRAVLIEREPAYQDDIRRRMALCLAGPDERARAIIKSKGETTADDLPLFASGGEL